MSQENRDFSIYDEAEAVEMLGMTQGVVEKVGKVTSFAGEHWKGLLITGIVLASLGLKKDAQAQGPYGDIVWGNPGSAPGILYLKDMNLCINSGIPPVVTDEDNSGSDGVEEPIVEPVKEPIEDPIEPVPTEEGVEQPIVEPIEEPPLTY